MTDAFLPVIPPGLPLASTTDGSELVVVWKDGRLQAMRQRDLRGTRTFSGANTPPVTLSALAALGAQAGDRWRDSRSQDEYKLVANIEPIVWALDGNVRGQDGASTTPGPPGRQGDPGEAGPPGQPGPRGFEGPRGPQGVGTQIKGSVPAPSDLPVNGMSGDGYIVTGSGSGYSAGDGYVYTGGTTGAGPGGAWTNVGAIRGPQGLQGPQGVDGAPGLRGERGTQGARGPQGASGAQGNPASVNGKSGPSITLYGSDLPVTEAENSPTVEAAIAAKFDKKGGSLSGNLEAPQLAVSGPSGSDRVLFFGTKGVARWSWFATGEAEDTGNAGSNLALARYAGDGSFIDAPLKFSRATGQATFARGFHVTGRLTANIAAADSRPIFDFATEDRNRTAEGGADAFQLGYAHVHSTVNPVGHRERAHTEIHSYGAAASKFIVDMTSIAWGHTGSGSLFAMNGVTIIEPEMAASTEASAAEFNTVVKRDVLRKTGIQIVDAPGSGGKGTAIDAGLLMGKTGGSFGYGHGFQIGDANDAGLYPTRAAILYSGVGMTEKGFDLRSTTLTSGHAAILRSGTRVSWAPDGNTAPTGGSIRSDANANGPNLVLASNLLAVQDAAGNAFATFNIAGSSLQPGGDGTIALGAPSLRWSQVYAATGAINTSDERLKQDIDVPSDTLLDAIGEVRVHLFRFRDAVAEKGLHARRHAGLVAQHLRAALIRHGIDPATCAYWCEDPAMEEIDETYLADEPVTQREAYEDVEITLRDDGTAVSAPVTRYRDAPVLDEVPVFDVSGAPIMLPAEPARMSKHKREDGTIEIVEVWPTLPERQQTVARPRMQRVEKTRRVTRQKRDADGTPVTVQGVRESQIAFLLFAWAQREIARLAARLPTAA